MEIYWDEMLIKLNPWNFFLIFFVHKSIISVTFDLIQDDKASHVVVLKNINAIGLETMLHFSSYEDFKLVIII